MVHRAGKRVSTRRPAAGRWNHMATPQPSTPRNHTQGAGRSSKPRPRRPTRWPKPEGAPKARAGIEDELAHAFERTVAEGHRRLTRTWPGLLATGTVGGIDISTGILGLLIVDNATNTALLGALAFPIGFIALTLASSELFTENFLLPTAAASTPLAGARGHPPRSGGNIVPSPGRGIG